ncbi:hypothetical protein NUSPORA_02288 [Nucleospora cyclopteri]
MAVQTVIKTMYTPYYVTVKEPPIVQRVTSMVTKTLVQPVVKTVVAKPRRNLKKRKCSISNLLNQCDESSSEPEEIVVFNNIKNKRSMRTNDYENSSELIKTANHSQNTDQINTTTNTITKTVTNEVTKTKSNEISGDQNKPKITKNSLNEIETLLNSILINGNCQKPENSNKKENKISLKKIINKIKSEADLENKGSNLLGFNFFKNYNNKPNDSKNSVSSKGTVTESDLIYELLLFIKKEDRSEKDIRNLLEMIKVLKNNKTETSSTMSRLISTVTKTVEKSFTVTITEGNTDNTKYKTDNTKYNTVTKDQNIDQNITIKNRPYPVKTTDSLQNDPVVLINDENDKYKSKDGNQKKQNTNRNDESIIDKIKALLNISKPKPFYDQYEFEKIKKEIEEKDKEIEKLKNMKKAKQIEQLENERFEAMKKKLAELSVKRKKIFEEMEKENVKYLNNEEISTKRPQVVTVFEKLDEKKLINDDDKAINDDEKKLINNDEKKLINNDKAINNENKVINDDKAINNENKVTKCNDKSKKCSTNQKLESVIKSAEISLKDKNTNKDIKINIPVKELNEAIESMNQ